jgi:hypothetical protein
MCSATKNKPTIGWCGRAIARRTAVMFNNDYPKRNIRKLIQYSILPLESTNDRDYKGGQYIMQ